MKVELSKQFGFEAAHWLPTFPEGHKCRRLHGHSFRIEVVVSGEVPAEQGYLLDFGAIAEIVQPLVERLDHRLLNDIEGLENPTAEQLARWLYDRIAPSLAPLASVRVQETCTSAVTYAGA